MKTLIFSSVIMALFICSCATETETELSDDQKTTIISEVEDQIAGIRSASIQLDVDAYIDYFSTDNFISSNAIARSVTSRSAMLDSLTNNFSLRESRQITQTENKVTVLKPDLALVTTFLYAEDRFKSGELNKVNVVITQLWKKEQNGWKVIYVHESVQPITEE